MISRYTRPEMGRIWEHRNRYSKWLEVEVVACEAMAEEGLIPREALENIKKKADFSVERILEIEEETKHDVIAFLTSVAEYVGPDSRYIHLGLTSSDILDTSFALLLKEAMNLIIKQVECFMKTLKTRAIEHKNTVMIGRSHGIHAEPITFGLKLAVWYSEMARNLDRLRDALRVISYGKLSGAVGTFANTSPRVEELACRKLGLTPAKISTQIIQRDRHAQYFTALAILLGTLVGVDPRDPATQNSQDKFYKDYTQFLDPEGLKGARIGVARNFFGFNDRVDEVMETCIHELKHLGAEIIDPANIEKIDELRQAEIQVLYDVLYAVHTRMLNQ